MEILKYFKYMIRFNKTKPRVILCFTVLVRWFEVIKLYHVNATTINIIKNGQVWTTFFIVIMF